jgi:formyltetrahydrofolate synthetase
MLKLNTDFHFLRHKISKTLIQRNDKEAGMEINTLKTSRKVMTHNDDSMNQNIVHTKKLTGNFIRECLPPFCSDASSRLLSEQCNATDRQLLKTDFHIVSSQKPRW